MDNSRFDALTRRLGRCQSRRGVLAAAAVTGVAAATTTAAAKSRAEAGAPSGRKQRADTASPGPCGDGGKKANKCRKDAQCCTGYCKKKKKLCRCKKLGQGCTDTVQCCPSLTGNSCQNNTCQPAPPCDVCATGCPFTSIQDAIEAANAGDTITLCAETYTENFVIDRNLTLAGAGTDATTLQGTGSGSVISTGGPTIEIRDLTITGGNSLGVGGGFNNSRATSTLTRVKFTDNQAGQTGGALDIAGGDVTLNDCTLTGNSAGAHGGGVNVAFSGTLTVGSGTSITGNSAGTSGGGIQTAINSTTTIDDGATVKDNDPDDCATDAGGTLNGTCPTP